MLEGALGRVKQTADPEQFQMFDLHVRLGLSPKEVARTLEVLLARVYLAKYKIEATLEHREHPFQNSFIDSVLGKDGGAEGT